MRPGAALVTKTAGSAAWHPGRTEFTRAALDARLVAAAVAAWVVAWLVPAVGARTGVVLGLGSAAGGVVVFASTARRPGRVGRPVRRGVQRHRIGRGADPSATPSSRSFAVAAAAVLFAMAAVAVAAAARVGAVTAGPVADYAAERRFARLELVVTGDAEPVHRSAAGMGGEPYVRVPARVERIDDTRVRVPVLVLADPAGWADFAPSTRVRAFGRLSRPRRIDGTAAIVSARGSPIVLATPVSMQRRAAELRAGLREAVAVLPAEERGLVPGLTVGDTTEMPPELIDQFRRAGLTHLTAVSGANLAVVTAVVVMAGRWVGIRGRILPLLALAAMIGFVVLARPQPSVVRAAAMATFAVLALLMGRRRAGLSSLCGAVLVLLLLDPWLARSYGFALSVLATGGLLVIAPAWRDALGRRMAGRGREPNRLVRLLADAVAIPAAAQLACLPVLVMLAGEISMVAVAANVLAVPAVAPVTVLGLVTLIAAAFSAPLAEIIGHLAGVPAAWIVRVAEYCSALPGAVVPWRAGVPGAVSILVVLALAVIAVPHVVRRPALAVAGALILVAVLARPILSPGWPPPGWLMVACDVGQGDGLVVRVEPRSAIVVDTGPEPALIDRCLRDLGVQHVPLLVLTHFHADHVFGLAGVLHGRRVGEILVSPLADPEGNAKRFGDLAEASRVRARVAGVGEAFAVGNLVLRVLGPDRLAHDGEGSAANNASVVLRVETGGLALLLTGDIEPPAQSLLLASGADLTADVYKVPHHGSAYQDPRLLDAVHPDVALISVGADNDYGHPAPSTLTALRAVGVSVARTDEHGDLAIVGSDGDARVIARR